MKRLLFFCSLLIVIGCHSTQLASTTEPAAPEYSIVYVIHGDANYLYHNAEGEALQADEQVLEEAKTVGQQATNGEVFVFHQKPESKILWLFPKKDRQFTYYKNGRLVHKQSYSPQSKTEVFTAEEKLFEQFSESDSPAQRQKIFLYFGHEIPDRSDIGYHTSRPQSKLNTQLFAEGMGSFLKSGKFDLAVLSTCNNGTPSMIYGLTPHTRHVLASPKNLHLSHIDTNALPELIEESSLSSAAIADSLAEKTYRRLASFLQTAITLSTYNTEAVARYLSPLAKRYNQHLTTLDDTALRSENMDCADLPFFALPGDAAGLQFWYRPPRFGQKTNASGFKSGWGCKINDQ